MLTRARSNESQKVNVAMRLQFSFSETQNYNLLRHRTSFSDHTKNQQCYQVCNHQWQHGLQLLEFVF